MTSEIEICNLALSNIRAGSINSFDESSLQAQVCKLKFALMRDRCLRDTVWNFNRTIKALALINVDIYNWAYAYSYPINCLKIHRIIPNYEEMTGDGAVISRETLPISGNRRQIPYETFNFNNVKVIGCNDTSLHIDYAMKIENTNLFSDDFVIAFSHLLASEIVISLVGVEKGRQLRSDSVELYQEYIRSAIASDMNDTYLQATESEYVTSRG